MGLIDPNILLAGDKNPLGQGIQQGMNLGQMHDQMEQQRNQLEQQQAQQARTLAARQAFAQAAQGQDITKPEGMRNTINKFAQAGFVNEASAVLEAHKDMFPQKLPNSFKFIEGPSGWAAGNEQTGQLNPLDFASEKKDQKTAEDLFETMKSTLDGIMTPSDPKKGWDPLTGEKGQALQKAISYMPAKVLKSKVAQDWVQDNSKEQQQTVFNPMMGAAMMLRPEMSAENRISGQNQKQSGDYEVAKRGALAFKADYDKYKKAIASGDPNAIKVAQQGMVDKYVTTSTGKATGEAQFKNFAEGQGIVPALQNLGDKLESGSMAPEKVFDAMNDITMSTAMKLNEKTKQANAMTRRQSAAENKAHGFNLDPESMITHPEDMLSQDSTAFASPSNPSSAIAQPKSKAEKDTLPPGTRYIGPDGKVAIKK